MLKYNTPSVCPFVGITLNQKNNTIPDTNTDGTNSKEETSSSGISTTGVKNYLSLFILY